MKTIRFFGVFPYLGNTLQIFLDTWNIFSALPNSSCNCLYTVGMLPSCTCRAVKFQTSCHCCLIHSKHSQLASVNSQQFSIHTQKYFITHIHYAYLMVSYHCHIIWYIIVQHELFISVYQDIYKWCIRAAGSTWMNTKVYLEMKILKT